MPCNHFFRWDLEKFHDLVQSGETFDSMDYVAPTPQWAVYGDVHQGFDPEETRYYRKKGAKQISQGC
jgi:tRNA wybutosine-synthesizing protein 1